jgi:predicted TIM-barrel fold metal-dependent hydrolase
VTITAPEPTTSTSTAALPKIISVDDHVIEPPNVWLDRLPSKYHDVAPRVERKRVKNLQFNGMTYTFDLDPEGNEADFWVYEDLIIPHRRIIAAVGYPKDEVTLTPITYDEMRPGCYDRDARLADMDQNWTEASLSFPTFPRFCGQTFLEASDRELALLCVKAYNDWMVEEWSAGTNGRLIPLIIVPLWDAQLAAEEIRRNAARGVTAMCFSEIPYHLGLPSVHNEDRYWDPMFQACEETQTVVCMHIGSSSKMPATSPDASPAVQATLSFNNAMGSMSDFFFSGVLNRFPEMKLAYSEGQIGWIPYILERADDVWNQFRGWAFDKSLVPEPPSTYYYRQMYGCFFRDSHGLKNLDAVGEDNITFEVDYPHSDSTWPDTRQIAEEMFAGLTEEQTYKIVRGNAIRMLRLDAQ